MSVELSILVHCLVSLSFSRMGISVRAVARAPGRATITALAMPLGGPDAHAGHKDILAYPVLKDTIVIEVSPKIGNECDKPILLPPHGNAQLRVDSRFAQGHVSTFVFPFLFVLFLNLIFFLYRK